MSGLGQQLPFNNNSFGLVYVRQALHHVLDLEQILREISRFLQPGGILIATQEHKIDGSTSQKIFLENHALHKYSNAETAHTIEEYKAALKSRIEIEKNIDE